MSQCRIKPVIFPYKLLKPQGNYWNLKLPNISLPFFHFTVQPFPPTFIIYPNLCSSFSFLFSSHLSIHNPCLPLLLQLYISAPAFVCSVYASPYRSAYHLIPPIYLCAVGMCEYLLSTRWNDSLIMFLLAIKKPCLYNLFSNICLILSPQIAV